MEFDPTTTATQLASLLVQGPQQQIDRESQIAKATQAGLEKLRSALSGFTTALSGLSSVSGGLKKNSATLSAGAGATATASASAQPGSYSFFVEQLASTHQIAYADLPAVPVALGGPLVVQRADGSAFNVNLLAADQDGDGNLNATEIARAINQASGNEGKVTAQVANTASGPQLILSSGLGGEDGAITLDASGLPDSALKASLGGAPTQLAAARDAVIWLGEQGSGLRIQQGSNSYTGIAGVSVNFTQAHSAGEAPLQLEVAADKAGTEESLRKFVSAYNALQTELNNLTKTSEDAASRGAFSTDAGVRNLRNRLNDLIRQDVGGLRISDLGIGSDRQGQLTLDTARLQKTLAANPEALDTVFGSAALGKRSGVLGAVTDHLEIWTKSGTGQLARRLDNVQVQQKDLTQRRDRLDELFNVNYERYLLQFSQLQSVLGQMNQTSGLFSQLGTA